MYKKERFEEEYLESLAKRLDIGFEELFYKDYSGDICDKDTEEFMEFADFVFKDCPFFTKRSEYELWICKNFLKKANLIAIHTGAAVRLSVNPLGDSVDIDILAETIFAIDDILLMLKHAILSCNSMICDSQGITLTYEFGATMPSLIEIFE